MLELILPALVVVPMAASYRRAPRVALPVVEDAAVLDIAFRRAGFTRKAAAAQMGIDEQELSRQMTTRGITSARLRLLGVEFMVIYAEELSRTTRDTESRLRAVEKGLEMVMTMLSSLLRRGVA